MANSIFIPRQIGAMDVAIWNRHAIAGSAVGDIDNGSIFLLPNKSAEVDEFEVWEVAIAGSVVTGQFWMAYSDEYFRPELQPSFAADDPRQFTNVFGKVFPAYMPQVGDLITVSASALKTAFQAGDEYVIPVAGELKMDWAAADPGTGLCYKLQQTIPLSFGSIGLNSTGSRETGYILECIRAR